ncbi:hypothetical protein CVT26_013838 [Gymnopilus dilepis]|uniref:Uncharacterized protein n=1 Tax=Gymnopilus dilepis TaxID=231916 RepID=A0A409Y5Z2_9AGAR|nr:hypothetical protein CVT26_013838 [Gymnopilus dilepis]
MSQEQQSNTTTEQGTPRRSYYDVLETWQNTNLFEDRITFNDAVELLWDEDSDRLIDAKVGTGYKASTWTMLNNKTGQDAVFVHAAVWQSSSDLYTGNFVPKGEEAPVRVAESRIQDVPNFKCDISYVFNTDVERSLYTNVEHFEDYIKTVDGFNRSNRPRSTWQDGSSKSAYSLSSKLFVKKSAKPRQLDFEPHEWLTRAVSNQQRDEYAINPDRPLYFDLVNNKAIKLESSDEPQYKYWTSELVPIEFMRVARASEFHDEDNRSNQEARKQCTNDGLRDGFSVELGTLRKGKKQSKSGSETASSGGGSQDGKDFRAKEEDENSPPIVVDAAAERGNKKKAKKGR